MTKFDSQNGWIQIAFANEEDTYVLPSMVSVNYQRFLFYCLKKAGYEAVFFWGDSDSKCELFYMDSVSAEYYEKIRPKGAWERLLGSSEIIPKNEEHKIASVKISNENVMEQLVYQIIKGKKKTALVIPMKVFDAFFTKPDRAQTLMQKYKEQKSNKNLILITSSVRAEDSNKYIIRENGILSKLFEEVRQAVIASKRNNLYECLQTNMGSKCTYLNELNSEMIRNIVRKQMLLNPVSDLNLSSVDMDCIAMVYEWYYKSKTFRENTPISLPENKKNELKVIAESLSNIRTLTTICTWMETVGEWKSADAFRFYLKNTYPKDVNKHLIYTDHYILRLWEDIVIPEGMLGIHQKSLKGTKMLITESIRSVILRNEEDLDITNLTVCMEQMKKSIKNKDTDSLRCAMNSVEFLLDNVYEREEAYQEIWSLYQMLFDICNEINKLKYEIEYNQQRIEELRKKFKQYGDEIDCQRSSGITDQELQILLDDANQCLEEAEIVNDENIMRKNNIHVYKDVISTIQQAIQGHKGGGLINIQGVYEQAMMKQNEMLEKNFEMIKKLEEMKKHHPTYMESKPVQTVSVEEAEAQYRVLAEQMKQLK